MESFLTVVSGLAWTIVYIDSIRIGFRQKTYAMPMAALPSTSRGNQPTRCTT